MSKFFKHLRLIIKHRHQVFKLCCKCGTKKTHLAKPCNTKCNTKFVKNYSLKESYKLFIALAAILAVSGL